jgi:hypothetical protein
MCWCAIAIRSRIRHASATASESGNVVARRHVSLLTTGSLIGPEEPRGLLEVGYEIGCGIDMSTSNGVTLAGSPGITPSLGASLGALPTALLPVLSTPINGVITVGLKPGLVVVVPVDRKEFKGPDPWVMISNFHVKIDGCVGQSFIRSYASLTRQTDQSDVVLSYVGVTKTV